MKGIARLADTVFITVSGYEQKTDADASTTAGFVQYLTKPVSINEVLASLALPSGR